MNNLCVENLLGKSKESLLYWVAKLLLFFFLLLIYSSCKDDFSSPIIDEEAVSKIDQITVKGYLLSGSPDPSLFVYLSSGSVENNNIIPVIDAKVDLYEGENWIKNFPFVLEEDGQICERYTTAESINFVSGKTYTLKVESVYGSMESTQTIPTRVRINSVTYEKNGIIDSNGDRADAINIEFDDPEGEKNYYRISVWGTYLFEDKDTSFISDLGVKSISVDPITDSESLSFSDDSIDGEKYILQMASFLKEQQSYPLEDGRMIEGQLLGFIANLSSVTEDDYYYWKSVETYDNDRENFIAIHGNVEGGLGIFTVSLRDQYVIEF